MPDADAPVSVVRISVSIEMKMESNKVVSKNDGHQNKIEKVGVHMREGITLVSI